MGVLLCSLWHVALFLCKYNFMVRFQLFHFEWQAGLWLGSEEGILVEQSKAKGNCPFSELEQATKIIEEFSHFLSLLHMHTYIHNLSRIYFLPHNLQSCLCK